MLQKEEVEESQQPKPAKALQFVFASPGSISSPARSVMSISSGEVVGHQGMPEAEGLEPAKAVNKPASKHNCKRPAAKKRKGGRKAKLAKAEKKAEPANADKEEEPGKAKKTKRPWVPSQSFGMVHETRANKKACIQAKEENNIAWSMLKFQLVRSKPKSWMTCSIRHGGLDGPKKPWLPTRNP